MSGTFKQPKGRHPKGEVGQHERGKDGQSFGPKARHDRLVPHTPHSRKGGMTPKG